MDEQLTLGMDTGLCWLVCLAAFVNHFCTLGCAYTLGVYYLVLLETFNLSNAATAWIGSLNFGVLCGVGPMVGFLITQYGCRKIIVAGGLVGSIGMILGSFMPNFLGLLLTMGLIAGIGFGMVFMTSVCVINVYFDKYRTIAMGLALSGAGFGTFLYAGFTQYLIDEYSWRGSLLINGAINLHVCAFGMLIWPSYYDDESSYTSEETTICVTDNEKDMLENISKSGALRAKSRHPRYLYNPIIDSMFDVRKVKSNMSLDKEVITATKSQNSLNTHARKKITSHVCKKRPMLLSIAPHLSFEMNFDTNSLHEGKTCSFNEFIKGELHDQTDVEKDKTANSKDLDNKHQKWNICKKLFVPHILLDGSYMLLCVATFLFCFGMSVFYTHISAFSRSCDHSEFLSALLLSVTGILNLLGRILLGILAHHKDVDVFFLFIVSYFISGLSLLACSQWSQFEGLVICSIVYGFFSAAFGPLFSEVTCMISGVENFSHAYGFLNMFVAIGSLLGAPVAGLAYDSSGYYPGAFLLAGAMTVLSALVLLLPWRWSKNSIKLVLETDVDIANNN